MVDALWPQAAPLVPRRCAESCTGCEMFCGAGAALCSAAAGQCSETFSVVVSKLVR